MSCGVVLLEKQDDDVAPADLYFTHRTAHGGDGDKEAAHGDLATLADRELARLKGKYSSVFADPVYPVDRSGG